MNLVAAYRKINKEAGAMEMEMEMEMEVCCAADTFYLYEREGLRQCEY